MPKFILIEESKMAKPLIDALAQGNDIEFRHNDGEWRLYNGCNLIEVCTSPRRYRVVTRGDCGVT